MSAQHTPGPWFSEPELEPLGGCLARGIMAQDTFIAYALFDDEEDGVAEANARLIALAPEMFEYIESSASNGCATAQALIARATPSIARKDGE